MTRVKRLKKYVIISIICLAILLAVYKFDFSPTSYAVRVPYVAGQFYPGTSEEINKMVNTFFQNVKPFSISNLKAIIAPHAGYIYSGQVAAFGYKALDKDFDKVFILADNHNSNARYYGISIPEVSHYKTPLGEVKLTKNPFKGKPFVNVPASHETHVIEVHLPFLQKTLTSFEILPMVIGSLNPEDREKVAEQIIKNLDETTLIVISTDLSHYHPYSEAVDLDTRCINAIEMLDLEEIKKCEMCSYNSVLILMEIANKLGWDAKILNYKNSGDTAGNKDRVVGYSSIVFYEELNEDEQKILLELARNTMEEYVRFGKIYEPDMGIISKYPKLLKNKAAFVTLGKKGGGLRGCIGHLVPQEPLYLSIRDNAISAASKDRRFEPVKAEELENIEVSISVLDIPTLVRVNAPQEYLEKLVPMEDGIIIVTPTGQSTYLPHVWQDFPDANSFLSQLCMKQGAMPDCWTKVSTKIYKYGAQDFHEN